MSAKPRVFWKPDEREAFNNFCIELRDAGNYTEIARAAMLKMPQGRRRPIDGAAVALVSSVLKKTPRNGTPVSSTPGAVVAPPVLELPATEVAPKIAETPQGFMSSASFPGIVDGVAHTIIDIIQTVLYDAKLRTALRDLIKETVAPEVAEKVETGVLWRAPVAGQEKRRRIVVAGGGAVIEQGMQQLRPLMRFYDFRVWNSKQQHPARLKQLLDGAEVVVMFPSSISHAGSDACRAWSRAGKGKLVQYTRSTINLVDDLPVLLGDEIKMQPTQTTGA